MSELIKIHFNEHLNNAVYAEELHSALGINRGYYMWRRSMFRLFEPEESLDYVVEEAKLKNGKIGKRYVLSLNTAKSFARVEPKVIGEEMFLYLHKINEMEAVRRYAIKRLLEVSREGKISQDAVAIYSMIKIVRDCNLLTYTLSINVHEFLEETGTHERVFWSGLDELKNMQFLTYEKTGKIVRISFDYITNIK